MIEQILSIAGAVVVFFSAVLRLNILRASRKTISAWRVLEVVGLAGLMGGAAGTIGEWFLENAEFHSETILLVSLAIVFAGISEGRLSEIVARLKGWDGIDRRDLGTLVEHLNVNARRGPWGRP
jgi:hypothetical protein